LQLGPIRCARPTVKTEDAAAAEVTLSVFDFSEYWFYAPSGQQ